MKPPPLIEAVGEWLSELVCNILVEIVRIVVMAIIQMLKWVVEAVVCLVERFCAYLYLFIGLALIALLSGLVATTAALPQPPALAPLLASAAVAAAALLLALRVCDTDACRLIGVLAWAFKWAIVLGALIAIAALSIMSVFIVVLYGGIVAALIWALTDRRCRVPRLLGQP